MILHRSGPSIGPRQLQQRLAPPYTMTMRKAAVFIWSGSLLNCLRVLCMVW